MDLSLAVAQSDPSFFYFLEAPFLVLAPLPVLVDRERSLVPLFLPFATLLLDFLLPFLAISWILAVSGILVYSFDYYFYFARLFSGSEGA